MLVNAGGCNVSLATVSVVNRCPRAEEELTWSAASKNCADIKHNCVFTKHMLNKVFSLETNILILQCNSMKLNFMKKKLIKTNEDTNKIRKH